MDSEKVCIDIVRELSNRYLNYQNLKRVTK